MSAHSSSLLPVVQRADNFPQHTTTYPTHHPLTNEQYTPFHVAAADHGAAGVPPVGLLRPAVLLEMLAECAAVQDAADARCYEFVHNPRTQDIEAVAFSPAVLARGREGMDAAIATTAARWRKAGLFSDALDGWRNELYAIYASPRSAALAHAAKDVPFGNLTFACERAACAVFGFATFGVHMTAYEGSGADMKIWVPRRAKSKPTWPGMLDNSVAGGIEASYSPRATMVKECDEEASLPEAFVEKYLRNAGVVSYFYITKSGFLQPEIEYIYDLPLPPRDHPDYVLPRPHDDEVESFELQTVPEAIAALQAGEFKPNSGLILVDFLMRHGFVTPDTEPNFIQMQWHMHRPICVGVPA